MADGAAPSAGCGTGGSGSADCTRSRPACLVGKYAEVVRLVTSMQGASASALAASAAAAGRARRRARLTSLASRITWKLQGRGASVW